jgi:hypothetical protein
VKVGRWRDVESKRRQRRRIEGSARSRAQETRKRHCDGSTGDSSRDSGDSSDYNKGKPEGDRTTDMATDRATRFRQRSARFRQRSARFRQRSVRFRQRSARFRQRSVTMVTITKESPRATGRDNSGDKYRDKNKDKSNGDLAANQGTRGSIPQEIV